MTRTRKNVKEICYVIIITCSCSDKLFLQLSFCLKKDMAEKIAGDLVRKSKVFLFPFFLIVRNTFAADAVVSLLMLDIGGGKLVSLAAVTSKKRLRG